MTKEIEASRTPAPSILAPITEPSVSSRVVNHLRNKMLLQTHFTCDDLRSACGLPETDYGAVSGTLSRARKAGLVEFAHVNEDGAYTYRVADRNAVMRTKAVRGQGGKAGSARKSHKQMTAPRVDKVDTPSDPPVQKTFDTAPIGWSADIAARQEPPAQAPTIEQVFGMAQPVQTHKFDHMAKKTFDEEAALRVHEQALDDAQQLTKVRTVQDVLLELADVLVKADALISEAFIVDAAPLLTTATKEQLLAELAKRMT